MRVNLARAVLHRSWIPILILAIPFAARAANDGEIRNYIISINRLYESLDYERALDRLQLARQVPRGTDEEVTLSLYEGIILYELGKQEPGASAFKSALFLRPDAKLPVQVAPKIEQLFESVRKQVKSEVATLLAPLKTEKTEPVRQSPPAPPAAVHDEHKQTVRLAPPEVSPGPPKITQQGGEPAPVQPLAKQDCGPKPSSVSSRNLKERQLWRMASIKHELCSGSRFQGLVTERWTDLKTRLENATTSQEQARISQDIDQFVQEVIYTEQWQAERREAERREAERTQLKESRAAANLDASESQTAVSAHHEQLQKRLLTLQEAFLRTDPPSRLPPIRELATLGQKIRTARTDEELKEAAHALDFWQQRYLPQ